MCKNLEVMLSTNLNDESYENLFEYLDKIANEKINFVTIINF